MNRPHNLYTRNAIPVYGQTKEQYGYDMAGFLDVLFYGINWDIPENTAYNNIEQTEGLAGREARMENPGVRGSYATEQLPQKPTNTS